MSKKTNLEKLRQAWDVAPKGAKERLYKHFNYNRQSANDIIRNGRKDDEKITRLLVAIKQASKDVLADINKANDKIQKI